VRRLINETAHCGITRCDVLINNRTRRWKKYAPGTDSRGPSGERNRFGRAYLLRVRRKEFRITAAAATKKFRSSSHEQRPSPSRNEPRRPLINFRDPTASRNCYVAIRTYNARVRSLVVRVRRFGNAKRIDKNGAP